MYSLLKTSVKVLLIFLSLTSEIISAQNFKAIKTDASYYFYDSTSMEIIAERIDSIALVGNETHYYAMRQIRYTDYSCFFPNGASWMGDVVIEKPNGIFQFVLYPFSPPDSADVFTIKCNALVGESWHFYNYHTTNQYVEATVTQAVTANFIGISDSVKTITLQRKNAAGQDVNDPINGQKILLSKNYGLIRLPKFDEFQTNLKFLDLCGKTNPVTGRTNLTFEEIFDFQPGDEFHIKMHTDHYYWLFPKEEQYLIQTIVSRTESASGDSITYEMTECKSKAYSDGVPGDFTTTYTNSYDTIWKTYYKYFDYPQLISLPLEPDYQGMEPTLTLSSGKMGKGPEMLNLTNKTWKEINAFGYLWNFGTPNCWQGATFDDYWDFFYFYEGLGGPYYDILGVYFPFGNYISRELVYYKKGSETWGTPLNCETLLHVGLPENLKNQEASIYPNPTSGIITVSCPTNWEFPCRLEIFDLSGRKAVEYKVNYQEQAFDLSGLPTGLYSYKLTSVNGDVFHGKIIRQ